MKRSLLILGLMGLSACSSTGSQVASSGSDSLPPPVQCVPFVRELSGVEIYGDAYTWWQTAAEKGYERGNVPRVQAVLVLKKTEKLVNGHVAMVRRIDSNKKIYVTHANWGSDEATRRLVHDAMPAIDVSPNNDWTSVEFFNEQAGAYGKPYPAWGFIYPKCPPPLPGS
jgi:hypothetical protein